MFSTKCKLISALTIGIILTISCTIFLLIWSGIYSGILAKNLILNEDSASYSQWKESQVPLFLEFYLFNWTNPSNLTDLHGLAKPKLVEHGPYVFREYRSKVNLSWFPENSTVTYYQNRTWVFEPTLTKGSLDDLITTISVPPIASAHTMRHRRKDWKIALDIVFNMFKTKLSVTRKVREFLFEGFPDELIKLGKRYSVSKSIFPMDKFGWFYQRNGSETYDGIFNVHTGSEGIEQLGQVAKWNYRNSTPFYKSHCGEVKGSAGEFFGPGIAPDKIGLFSSDACRTLILTYEKDVTIDGINAFRFVGDDTMFYNESWNADNWCYCPEGKCTPNGVFNLGPCKWDSPVYLSFPHFYNADPSFRDAVKGMNPNKDLHQMRIDVEPISGIPIHVSAGMQVNILVEPTKDYKLLKNVSKIYFPSIWFRSVAKLDADTASQIRRMVNAPNIVEIIFILLLAIGLLLITFVALSYDQNNNAF